MFSITNLENMSESKREALPKRGHVNEVCKEWLVREDGALAYKLQSQEINDFYKGNRYRNEVVRTDFPTALNEQIKEKENAQKQTESYKKYLSEQEEHDKRVAMKIAEKLEKDLFEQRQRELEESEEMADKLQSIYVNLPPTGMHERQLDPYSENASISQNARASTQIHSQEVGLPLSMNSLNSQPELYHQSIDHAQMNRQSKKAHKSVHDPHDPSMHASAHLVGKNGNRPKHHAPHTQQSLSLEKIVQYSEATDASPSSSSVADPTKTPTHIHAYKNNMNKRSPCDAADEFNFQRLPRETFDSMLDSSSQQRLQHMQEHADDIELYVDPSLQEIGLPMDEIKEMSKKIKQEKKDEALARKLQEMEQKNGMTLEDRDRLLAIEAQDKELAKMLQEREKAKAKRAKEKARLRKHQYQKEANSTHCGPLLPLPQDSLLSSSKTEEIDPIDLEAYSNPKDLISHQRIQSEAASIRGSSVHSTLDHADNNREDDIYTLPVDSCGPNRSVSLSQNSDSSQNHSLSRSEHFSSMEMQHEPHDSLRMNHSMSSSFDQNSSPAPPYMPIQGTRRSNSNEERKKRSKDKCTHQ